jgi:hypothetical protein
VKTGFSLSRIRAQTRDMGRIMSGLIRNDPTKTIERANLNKLGNKDNKRSEKSYGGLIYRIFRPDGLC